MAITPPNWSPEQVAEITSLLQGYWPEITTVQLGDFIELLMKYEHQDVVPALKSVYRGQDRNALPTVRGLLEVVRAHEGRRVAGA